MTGFTEQQIADLSAPLARAAVKSREQGGRQVSYIEGWHVIAEANRIFGFDAWDRETVECRCVAERETKIGQQQADGWRVGYIAKVRISVWPGPPGDIREVRTIREGTGYGSGIDRDLGAAHESAIKEAETDAMKRALMTFGNPFGLALYDKTQSEVEPLPQRGAQKPTSARQSAPPPSSHAGNGIAPPATTGGQLPPVNPEEPPEVEESRQEMKRLLRAFREAANETAITAIWQANAPEVIKIKRVGGNAAFEALSRAAQDRLDEIRQGGGGLMGVHQHGGTMPGGITPICNRCGVSLCWDISADEYGEDKPFWDAWICQDCNGGKPMSLRNYRRLSGGMGAAT